MHVRTADPRRLLAVLAAVLVLPAVVFLGSAIGRSLQPVTNQPARTLDAIVAWFLSLGQLGLVAVGLLPLLGIAAGAAAVGLWLRRDAALAADLGTLGAAAVVVLRRPSFVLAALAVLLGLVCALVVGVHALAG